MLKKVLIANRGEIALRIMRACKELDIKTVAIFADNDRDSLHISYADEAYNLGTGALKDTYLNIDKIIDIAIKAGAEAIHPGYGFLSEKSAFSKACEDRKVIFIGPTSDSMYTMGDKLRARQFMKDAGLPMTPGTDKGVRNVEEVIAFGEKYGYPIALKASSGGGGRGLRPIFSPEHVQESLEGAMREGLSYFGDDTVYIEKFLPNPRHIEVQVIGDGQGNVIHLGERNCSIQRRHQKLVEESPSPLLSEDIRAKITNAAVQGAKHLKYRSAGTFEFLEQDGEFFFMEVNTRLQVEHPVTEMIYGIDIVKEQLNIAAGNKLSYQQSDIKFRGHAIECRITVEDVKSNFRPMAGFLEDYSEPVGFGVRVDATGYKGWNIPSEYDSMIAKLVVWDETRERAIKKMYRALSEYKIAGVPTTIGFHKWVMQNSEFIEGSYSTSFIPKNFKPEFLENEVTTLATAEPINREKESMEIEVNGKLFKVDVYKTEDDKNNANKTKVSKKKKETSKNSDSGDISAPMAGTVVKVLVEKGATVKQGDVLLVVEAMKMESDIVAPKDGTVKEVNVKATDSVTNGQLLLVIV